MSKNKKALVPRYRFPEFRNRGAWEEKKIRELFNLQVKPEKALFFEREKLITVKLHTLGAVRNEKNNSLTGGTNYFKRKAGDFIFSKIDLLNGAFDIVPEVLDGFYSSTDVPAFSFNNKFNPNFFLYWLKANYLRIEIERTGTSKTLKRISPQKFINILFSCPNLNEQQRITSCLTSLDELITGENSKLDAYEDHKKGLMQKLFLSEEKTVPEWRFPEFRDIGDWEKQKINMLLRKISKPVEVDPVEFYQEIGIRSHGKGIFHKVPIQGKDIGNKRVFWIEDNAFIVNIVFAWEQAIACTTNSEKGMIASHRFPMYKAHKNKADVRYLKYFFLTDQGKELLWIASPGGAGRNKTLGQKEFEKLVLLVPRFLEEQQRIADCLTSIDELITAQTQKVESLKTYKKSLMQGLFPSAEEVEE